MITYNKQGMPILQRNDRAVILSIPSLSRAIQRNHLFAVALGLTQAEVDETVQWGDTHPGLGLMLDRRFDDAVQSAHRGSEEPEKGSKMEAPAPPLDPLVLSALRLADAHHRLRYAHSVHAGQPASRRTVRAVAYLEMEEAQLAYTQALRDHGGCKLPGCHACCEEPQP